MTSHSLLYPMMAHVCWVALLYALLTLVRAPSVWNIGQSSDGRNPWVNLEPRVSANLSNQFEWPVLFYIACVLVIVIEQEPSSEFVWLSWMFVAGRILHSAVQIATTNIRLRGIVFTINFIAVLGLWGLLPGLR